MQKKLPYHQSQVMEYAWLKMYGHRGQASNKETSLRDEANDWEGVCIPFPIRAQESHFASLVAGAPFGLKAEV
ncbi:MAG: hypothetical protein ACNA7G_07825 [Methylobacter sp.]